MNSIKSFLLTLVLTICINNFSEPTAFAQSASNLVVSTGDSLMFYNDRGTLLRSYKLDVSVWKDARDVIKLLDGRYAVYNGTFDPKLTICSFSESDAKCEHHSVTGWNTVNNVTYGGIAQHQDYIYLTNTLLYTPGDTAGITRFNLKTKTFDLISGISPIDLTVRQFGNTLFVLDEKARLTEYHTLNMEILRTVQLPSGTRTIAVDQDYLIYAGTWAGELYKVNSNGDILAKSEYRKLFSDIDISEDGLLLAHTADNKSYLIDNQLNIIKEHIFNSYFGTFDEDNCVLAPIDLSLHEVSGSASGYVYNLSMHSFDSASCMARTYRLEFNSDFPAKHVFDKKTLTMDFNGSAGSISQLSFSPTSPLLPGSYKFSVTAYTELTDPETVEEEFFVQDSINPVAPTKLKATSLPAKILLKWQPARDNVAVAGYNVYLNGKIIAQTKGTSFEYKRKISRLQYAFKVAAFDAQNNLSKASNKVLVR